MGRKPKSKPSFFKIMVNNFTKQLQLPSIFVKKNREFLQDGKAKLRISSGETWDVKLKQCIFIEGWNKFAKDVGLEFGEFLIFKFCGKYVFDVSVYGISGCEREIKLLESESDCDEETEVSSEDEDSFMDEDGNDGACESVLYFEYVLKKHQTSRVGLSKAFAKAADLTNKKSVMLEHMPSHSFHEVQLCNRQLNGYNRLEMAKGWCDFRNSNRLALGKTYSFEFKPDKNVIQVQQVKNPN